MSRIAAGGTKTLLPIQTSGYVSANAPNVLHLLRRDLRRAGLFHRDRPDPPLMTDLSNALDQLEPGARALLELSLQRGIPDDELARILGTNAGDIDKRRRQTLAGLAHDL